MYKSNGVSCILNWLEIYLKLTNQGKYHNIVFRKLIVYTYIIILILIATILHIILRILSYYRKYKQRLDYFV